MALYLVQHGQSLPKELDPERGLSEEGFREVQLIADQAREHNLCVSRIVHSGKKRASQTAHLLYEVLVPEGGVARAEGLDPLDDVSAIADKLDLGDNLMLVGHLPFLDRLVSVLITGTPDHAIVRFQNGGILCLDQDAKSGARFIKWTLFPFINSA